MSTSFRAVTRAGLVGGATLLAAVLTATSASAASGELAYSCDYGVGDTEGTGAATATWDSGIGGGLVTEVGRDVSLDPFTGTITVPEGFTQALRDAGIDEVDGQRPATTGDARGLLLTLVDGSDEEYPVELSFHTFRVPAEGPLVITVGGEGGTVFPAGVGTNTLVASDFVVSVGTGKDGPDADMACTLTDKGDVSIDTFEATAAPTPTGTPTVEVSDTASPERPDVVQTDFADDGHSTAAPLVLGGAAAGAGVALVARGVRRGSIRRH